MTVAALVAAMAGAAAAGLPTAAPAVWCAVVVLAASHRYGPRGVLPVAVVVAVVAVTPGHALDLRSVQGAAVLAVWYIAFGLMTSAAFHLLFRRLQHEHDARVADVEAEKNRAMALVREREQLQQRLSHSATHDPLTGLANRVLLMSRTEQALAAARHRGVRCAIMYVDLDDFKPVNDLFGHATGDNLLRIVAERLQNAVRDEDLVARLGGDEFAVLFPELPTDAATGVVKRVYTALNSPVRLVGRTVEVKASVGLAVSAGDDQPMDLLGKADMAMYAVKATGKNDIAVYETRMTEQAQARRRLEEDLRNAVEHNELRLFYQPIVDLAAGHIVGFEALVRWEHHEHGLIPPDDFIPLAEETGSIVPIGQWVLEQACRQLRAWDQRRDHLRGLTLAVNLSARQLADPAAVDGLQQVIVRSGIDPRRLVLEVTESLAMDHHSAVDVLWQLKGLGPRVALDDFGTGYSSLSRLGQLPLDKLKIDKSFVLALASETDARTAATLIRSSVAMAHGLGHTVVAEGIERPEDVALLRFVGCDQGQGYLFGRPAPACDFDVDNLSWLLPAPDGTLLEQQSDDTAAPQLAVIPTLNARNGRPSTPGRFRGLQAVHVVATGGESPELPSQRTSGSGQRRRRTDTAAS